MNRNVVFRGLVGLVGLLVALSSCSASTTIDGAGVDSESASCADDSDDLGYTPVNLNTDNVGVVGMAGGVGKFWIVAGRSDGIFEVDAETGGELRYFEEADLTPAPEFGWINPGAGAFRDGTLYVGVSKVMAIDLGSLEVGEIDIPGRGVGIFSAFSVGEVGVAGIDAGERNVILISAATDVEAEVLTSDGDIYDVAVIGDRVVWVDFSGQMFSYSTVDKATTELVDLGPDPGNIAASKGRVVALVDDNNTAVSIDPATGETVSETNIDGYFWDPRLSGDGCSVWGTSEGEFRWNTKTVCVDGCLFRLDPSDGSVMAVVELRGRPGGPAVMVANGRVLVAGVRAGQQDRGSGYFLVDANFVGSA